ncbi:MAG: CRISPR-associated endoribonuclease Cas6 [Leptospirillum sp.]
MIRLRIDLPFNAHKAVCQDRGSIKNIVDSALSKHGYHRIDNRPVRYGFGVISRPVGKGGLRRVERIYLGSSDPEIAVAMSRIVAEDLCESSLTPGAGLDLREARIFRDDRWIPCEAMSLYAVSPIRVLSRDGRDRSLAILNIGTDFSSILNRIMETRFGRPFCLTFIPDRLYSFMRKGHLSASMAVGRRPDGRVICLPGIVTPFVLTGPPDDLRDSWFSGLGAGTGMGFGCVEETKG